MREISRPNQINPNQRPYGTDFRGVRQPTRPGGSPDFFQPDLRERHLNRIREQKLRRNELFLKASLLVGLAFFVFGIVYATLYFYGKYKESPSFEINDTVKKVGELMYLPDNEKPTVATVKDKEKIAQQEFFVKAENGDKMLVYEDAKLVILYRPSTNKLVAVSSLSLGENDKGEQVGKVRENLEMPKTEPIQTPPQEQKSEEITPETKEVTVAIYNGSKSPTLAAVLGSQISKIDSLKVTESKNTLESHEKTIVVDLNGTNGELVKKIAETIGGEVGQLPEKETKPQAEILVIGGDDLSSP